MGGSRCGTMSQQDCFVATLSQLGWTTLSLHHTWVLLLVLGANVSDSLHDSLDMLVLTHNSDAAVTCCCCCCCRPFLLSVEDPAMPGRDMSSGSFAIRDVRAAFMRAATTLRELTTSHEDTGKGPNQHTTSTAAAGGAAGALQQSVAAAAAAAVLAGGKKGGVQPQTPQQQHQQATVTFDVVEDREAWSAVQADGQSRSFDAEDSPAQPAAAAAAGWDNSPSNIIHSSSGGSLFGFAAVAGMGAVAASIEQQLGQGLREGLGMLGRLVDVVAAVGRGAAADAHRSEQARQAALRGQARWVA